MIAEGKTIDESNRLIGMVSEGLNTSKILHNKVCKKLDMPICKEVYNVLYKNHDPRISLEKLMTRKLKNEIII